MNERNDSKILMHLKNGFYTIKLWVWVVIIRRTGLQRLVFKSHREPAIVDLKHKIVADLVGSRGVAMEAIPGNENNSNGVVECAARITQACTSRVIR